MNRLVIEFISTRDRCGALTLFDERGRKICGPFPVAGRASEVLAAANGNASRDTLLCYGDTPAGGYAVRQLLKSGNGTYFPTAQFGSHGVVVLEPISGDAACAEANGRFHFLITGGKLSASGQLRSTAGSLRLSNEHQRALFAALQKKREVRCDVVECERLPKLGNVFVDPSCEEKDPPALPLGETTSVSHAFGRDALRGSAASVMLFGFSVSFVALASATPTQAATPVATQSAPSARELGKLMPPKAAAVRGYTKLAYNSSGQGIGNHTTYSQPSTPPSTTSTAPNVIGPGGGQSIGGVGITQGPPDKPPPPNPTTSVTSPPRQISPPPYHPTTNAAPAPQPISPPAHHPATSVQPTPQWQAPPVAPATNTNTQNQQNNTPQSSTGGSTNPSPGGAASTPVVQGGTTPSPTGGASVVAPPAPEPIPAIVANDARYQQLGAQRAKFEAQEQAANQRAQALQAQAVGEKNGKKHQQLLVEASKAKQAAAKAEANATWTLYLQNERAKTLIAGSAATANPGAKPK